MDYAIAVEQLVHAADYRRSASYQDLADTWADSRPLPSETALITAYEDYLADAAQHEEVKTAIRNKALQAVGLTLLELRNNKNAKDSLLAILLMQAGAVASDGTIRPLSEWVSLER